MSEQNDITLTQEEIATIKRILNKRTFEGDEFEITFDEICGFITGVVCGPQILFPPMWISQLVGEKAPTKNEQELRELFDLLEKIYNIVAANLRDGQIPPKELFPAHPELIKKQSFDAKSISIWCEGFYDALTLDESWLDVDPFLVIIFPIAAFISEEDSEMWQEICDNENKTKDEMRDYLIPKISESILTVYNFILQLKFGIDDSISIMGEDDDFEVFLDESEEDDDDKEKDVILH